MRHQSEILFYVPNLNQRSQTCDLNLFETIRYWNQTWQTATRVKSLAREKGKAVVEAKVDTETEMEDTIIK